MILPATAQTSLPTAISPQGADGRESCERQVTHAMREMGAFVMAVRKLYGSEEAAHAAERWVELAENADVPLIDGYPTWRHITIAAAGQIAKDRLLAHLSAPTRDGVSQPF
jgi:hypothetical protein